ncbi:hypothetical protein LguiA_021607 [Lonicera macranthoides]
MVEVVIYRCKEEVVMVMEAVETYIHKGVEVMGKVAGVTHRCMAEAVMVTVVEVICSDKEGAYVGMLVVVVTCKHKPKEVAEVCNCKACSRLLH